MINDKNTDNEKDYIIVGYGKNERNCKRRWRKQNVK